MAKVLKARTLEEAFDSRPDECVVEPQYDVELVELKEKGRKRPVPSLATQTLAPE